VARGAAGHTPHKHMLIAKRDGSHVRTHMLAQADARGAVRTRATDIDTGADTLTRSARDAHVHVYAYAYALHMGAAHAHAHQRRKERGKWRMER